MYVDNILDRLGHRTVSKKDKRIPFTTRIVLRHEEREHEFCCVWNEMFEFPVDGEESKDSILSDVSVSVFETGAAGGYERFQEF